MKHVVFVLGALSFGLSPAFAADTVKIGLNVSANGMNSGVKLSATDTILSGKPVVVNYAANVLSFTNAVTNTTFSAFGIEPAQGFRGTKAFNYTVESFTGTQATLLQGLFSTQYGGLSTDSTKAAAFQAAVWEIVSETSGKLNLSGGTFSVFSQSESKQEQKSVASVIELGNSFLAAASSYTGAAQYSLVKLSNDKLQDLVMATPLAVAGPTVTPVPEPETYALLLAGLGVVALKARRRSNAL